MQVNLPRAWLRAVVLLTAGWVLMSEVAWSADGLPGSGVPLTGTIYEAGSDLKKVLFKYRRVASPAGSLLRVVQEYFYPDGKPAAREIIFYKNGELVSFELEELQTGARGKASIEPRGRADRLVLRYVTADGDEKEDDEAVRGNTIVNDMIPAFLQRNWNELMRGKTISSRFIAISRAETVGFEFEKLRETVWNGKSAVVVRMKPSSFIIAALVDPLFFTVEAGGEHRVLSYAGRTTPKVKKGGKWKDLEAVTVFDF